MLRRLDHFFDGLFGNLLFSTLDDTGVGRRTEQGGLEFLVARKFVLVEQRDTRRERFFRDERSDVFLDMRVGLFERHDDAFAMVDRYGDLEIAEAQDVSVK